MKFSPYRINATIFTKTNGTPIGHDGTGVVIIATHQYSHLAAIR